MRLLQLKVNSIAKDIEKAKRVAMHQEKQRVTFGQGAKVVKMGQDSRQEVEQITRMGMRSQVLSVEQAMHLVQTLAQYKSENTKLRLRVREQELQIKHMES